MSQLLENLFLFCLKYSRKTLLILLRTTALPTFFVTVKPIRDFSYWPGVKTAIKYFVQIVSPFLAIN